MSKKPRYKFKPIKDVETSTEQLIFGKDPRITRLWATAGLIWFVGSLFLIYKNVDYQGLFLLLGGVAALGLAARWIAVRTKVHAEFMRQFAKRNNFHFSDAGNTEGRKGILFDFGHDKYLLNEVSGSIQNFPFKLYNYSCTTGSGKSAIENDFTVIEIKALHNIPQLFLNSKKTPFMSDWKKPVYISHDNALKLEGDFNEYFDLYVPTQYEQEVLEILTPNVMAELIDTSQGYDLEIVGRTVRVIGTGFIKDVKVLDEMFIHAKNLIKVLEKTLTKFKYTPIGDFAPSLETDTNHTVQIIAGIILIYLILSIIATLIGLT